MGEERHKDKITQDKFLDYTYEKKSKEQLIINNFQQKEDEK